MQDTNISYRSSEAREFGVNIAILLNNIRVFTEYHNQKGDKEYWHSMIDIAEAVGLTKYQISEAAKRAKDLGLIDYRQGYKPNTNIKTTYWVLTTSESKETAPSAGKETSLSGGLETKTSLYNLKDTNLKTNLKDTAKADNEVSKLYYQYLKKYSIPVLNHTVLKAKIAELEKLRGTEWCVRYLTFMLDHYEFADFRYKPEINDALDLYRKSKSIETAMSKQLEIGKVY